MADVADFLSELTQTKLLNVLAVYKHLSIVGIIETFNQLHNSALTRARGAHDGSSFTDLKLEGKVLQHLMIWSRWVEEVDVFEFNDTLDVIDSALAPVVVLVNVRLPVDDIKGQLACNLALSHSLHVRGSQTHREHSKDNTEEAR